MSPSSAWTSWQGWCEARGIQRNQGSGGFPLSQFWRFLNCFGGNECPIYFISSLFGGGVCIYLHPSQKWKIGTSKKIMLGSTKEPEIILINIFQVQMVSFREAREGERKPKSCLAGQIWRTWWLQGMGNWWWCWSDIKRNTTGRWFPYQMRNERSSEFLKSPVPMGNFENDLKPLDSGTHVPRMLLFFFRVFSGRFFEMSKWGDHIGSKLSKKCMVF